MSGVGSWSRPDRSDMVWWPKSDEDDRPSRTSRRRKVKQPPLRSKVLSYRYTFTIRMRVGDKSEPLKLINATLEQMGVSDRVELQVDKPVSFAVEKRLTPAEVERLLGVALHAFREEFPDAYCVNSDCQEIRNEEQKYPQVSSK